MEKKIKDTDYLINEKLKAHVKQHRSVNILNTLATQFDSFYFSMMMNSPCNKLYLRTHMETRFPQGIPMGEDLMFNMAFLDRVESVAVIDADGYRYDQTPVGGSACARFVGETPEKMLDYCNCVLPFLKRWLSEREWSYIYDRIVFHSLCNNLHTLARKRERNSRRFWAYLELPAVQNSIKNVDLQGFPVTKRIVGRLLKLHLASLAIAGLRVAAR